MQTNYQFKNFITKLNKMNIAYYLESDNKIFFKHTDNLWAGIELFENPFGLYSGNKYILVVFDPREGRQGLLRIPFIPNGYKYWDTLEIDMIKEINTFILQIAWEHNAQCLNRVNTLPELIMKYDEFMKRYKTEERGWRWCNFNNLEIQRAFNYDELYKLTEELKKHNAKIIFEYEKMQLYPQRMFIGINKDDALSFYNEHSWTTPVFTCDTWGCYEFFYKNIDYKYKKLPFIDKKFNLEEIVYGCCIPKKEPNHIISITQNTYCKEALFITAKNEIGLTNTTLNSGIHKKITDTSYNDLANKLLFMILINRNKEDIINYYKHEICPHHLNNQVLMEEYIKRNRKIGHSFLYY